VSARRYARGVDAIVTWILGTAFVAAGAELASVNRTSPFRNLVEDLPTTPLHALRPGLVKVVGRAVAHGDEVKSPITGRRGVALHIRLSGKFGLPLLLRGASDIKMASPFFLEDENLRVLVEPASSLELFLSPEAPSLVRGEVPPKAHPELRQRFSPRAWDDRIANRDLPLHFRETLLTNGARVAIVAYASPIVHAAGVAPHPRAPTELWHMEQQPHQPLVIASDPGLLGRQGR